MKVGEKTNFGRLATIFQYFLRNYQEMGFFPSLHIYKNLPRITVLKKLKCPDPSMIPLPAEVGNI